MCIFFVDTIEQVKVVKANVQKWGNSLAIRIPKALASQMHLSAASEVELTLEDGKLSLEPVPAPQWRLEILLAGVTAANVHGEVRSGIAVGDEAW